MNTATSPSARESYESARRRAAILDRSSRGRLIVSGQDRASYLQGLLTNDIPAVTIGQGCYSAYLTPQGRMIADLWVYELGDVILLSMVRDVKDTVLAQLDRFVFTEDVQLGDVSDTFSGLAVVGPQAPHVVAATLSGAPEDTLQQMPVHGNLRAEFNGQPAIVLRIRDTGEPGFDLLVDASQGAALNVALRAAGAVEVDAAVAEVLRLEDGIPKFHSDMDEETIPLEAGIESQAISLTKGCYVGQEVIIRVLHRGHGRVARKLVGLTFGAEVAVPSRGAHVQVDARDVGRVTSSVFSLALKHPIALAMVQRDFVEPGTRVQVEGAPAEVAALPFVESQP